MYEVGQLLYLILNKKQQVIPVQVVEQMIRRTLAGEETLYSVKIPTKEQLYKLEELDAEVYDSLEDIREKLHYNATLVIDGMISKASELAEKNFEKPPLKIVEPIVSTPSVPEKSKKTRKPRKKKNGADKEKSRLQVTLEDGTVANVSMTPLLID